MAIHDHGPIRGRRRFSDDLEYRRGRRDAEAGRAPASNGGAYMLGYAEVRRRQPRRGPRQAAGGRR
jgi:hypothetical protein